MRTFGVEEELLIVNPDTGEPLALADALLAVRTATSDDGPESDGDRGLTAELKLEQIEIQTLPCRDYTELLQQIRDGRALADQAARQHGARVAALATSPLASTTHITPDPRYAAIKERFGLTLHELLTCGFHVHTFIQSPEEGVAVLDRIRDKLAILVALSANSPFWNGVETGFESYRTQAWNRLPTSGPSAIFGTLPVYRRTVARLLETGVLLDEGMIYFDARLARNHPTVEVRVADVCLRAEDAALIAVLVRALVETASREWRDDVDPLPVPTVLLRTASWQASNRGLRGELLHFGTFTPAPAADVVNALVDYLEPVLREQGELEQVRAGVTRILSHGTGAEQQRRAREEAGVDAAFDGGGLAAVVAHAVEVTMHGVEAIPTAAQPPVLQRVRRL
ncbi:glutamate--cysteine ligase 2 [Arthrobacter rhizosphaerae]|uniref:glutamate--cysteine ligase 2 n=1 Tax=Arthrobacter rhizosphaerae TaxID=2855490 RepID=UPI001FF11E4E|nr:glutamate--cysteine ligase [Arthrobacter rhizosphaerae]